MRAVDPKGFRKPTEIKKFLDTLLNSKLEGTGITASSAVFLMEMDGDSGVSNKELSERVGVTTALTTRISKQLFDAGLAENRPCGREYRITLTPEGVRMRALVERLMAECLEILYSDFTEEEIATMSSLFTKIDRRIDRYLETGV